MERELGRQEIWVVDQIFGSGWSVVKVNFTKESEKCYILRNITSHTRHFKKDKCFKNYTDACKMATGYNEAILGVLEIQLKRIKKLMKDHNMDTDEQKVEDRFSILDL